MLAQEVYDQLKKYGYCRSEGDYSQNFLDKSPRYFSTIKAKKIDLPIGCKTILATRVNHLITCMKQSPSMQTAVKELSNLQSKLNSEIKSDCLKGFAVR